MCRIDLADARKARPVRGSSPGGRVRRGAFPRLAAAPDDGPGRVVRGVVPRRRRPTPSGRGKGALGIRSGAIRLLQGPAITVDDRPLSRIHGEGRRRGAATRTTRARRTDGPVLCDAGAFARRTAVAGGVSPGRTSPTRSSNGACCRATASGVDGSRSRRWAIGSRNWLGRRPGRPAAVGATDAVVPCPARRSAATGSASSSST